MMKNRLLASTAFLLLFILGSTLSIFAQDTTKTKAVKPVVKAPVKPYAAKPGATKYYGSRPYQAKPVGAQVPATGAAATPQQPIQAPAETPVSTDKSLRGQYQYVMSKTYHYQQPMIAALWKNVTDSLNVVKKEMKDAEAKLATQTKSVTSLQNDIKTNQQAAADATENRDAISLLGISMSKTAYNFLMWGLVLGMALVLVIVFMRTSGAHREAKYRSQLFDEVNEEFTVFKAKAKEEKMKLARELQTERNKVDELMGRG